MAASLASAGSRASRARIILHRGDLPAEIGEAAGTFRQRETCPLPT